MSTYAVISASSHKFSNNYWNGHLRHFKPLTDHMNKCQSSNVLFSCVSVVLNPLGRKHVRAEAFMWVAAGVGALACVYLTLFVCVCSCWSAVRVEVMASCSFSSLPLLLEPGQPQLTVLYSGIQPHYQSEERRHPGWACCCCCSVCVLLLFVFMVMCVRRSLWKDF